MNLNLFIYLFIYLFISCKDSSNSSKIVKEKSSISNCEFSKKETLIKTITIDTLSIKQVKFNNMPFNFKYSEFRKFKKDSIIDSKWDWECGNPFGWESYKFKYVYINGTEYLSNNKEVHLISADLKEHNNTLTLNINNKEIDINRGTSLNDMKSLFPNSEIIDLPNKLYIQISFNTSIPEDSWNFYFNQEGFLIRFELYWWLC